MLLNDDCLVAMQKLIDDGVQVDSIVTDPPYHLQSIVDRFKNTSPEDDTYTSEKVRNKSDGYSRLIATGFMGQEWDGGDIAFRKETWELAMKLLKPGGHLLAFSASRNYHRMAVAIEDAGFEIRDQLMWLYGSGFPKSLNIGKSIDKKGGKIGKSAIELKTKLIELVNKCGKTRNQIDKECGFRASNYLTLPKEGKKFDAWVNILPTDEKWLKMKEVINCGDDLDNIFASAEREVIGKKKLGKGVAFSSEGKTEMDITKPKTDEAKQWEGWGTALKPAHEPIVMARKPLSESSIVDNVLKHGTGGINIDGCRIGLDENDRLNKGGSYSGNRTGSNEDGWFTKANNRIEYSEPPGRFPANVMHDGLQDDWARFFYCPKISKCERGEDNTHPTVKPQELMKYLCRLVTPKSGTVLDPFMGSGSTGMAAKDEGFEFIGIEREKEYFEIAEKRINAASPLMEFFESGGKE